MLVYVPTMILNNILPLNIVRWVLSGLPPHARKQPLRPRLPNREHNLAATTHLPSCEYLLLAEAAEPVR